jgi:hypothetical protein
MRGSSDYPVGLEQHRLRNGQAKLVRGVQIDGQLRGYPETNV